MTSLLYYNKIKETSGPDKEGSFLDYEIDRLFLQAETHDERAAADILKNELFPRTGKGFFRDSCGDSFSIRFTQDHSFAAEGFEIRAEANGITLRAKGLRGLIFAVGRLLRKMTPAENGGIRVSCAVLGSYSPKKPIRGHQTGFRGISNTYDAWDAAQFRRYALELMFFGANTVEHIPSLGEKHNAPLMRCEPNELLRQVSVDCDSLDLDLSLWIPNEDAPIETLMRRREALFRSLRRLDAVFVPGSDPGDRPAEECIEICARTAKLLSGIHPKAKVWPSAQAPHGQPDWGERFLQAFRENGAELAGVITGPNRAFPIDTLAQKLPAGVPIRFYPDITHTLRCEHPVHFWADDWHYAYASTLSRECVDPRPEEYARLHKTVSRYTVGSVSYSEGVNDDLNKAVWSALEWAPYTPLREILEDYARLYLWGADPSLAADGILGLEQNWNAAPDLSASIAHTLAVWERIGETAPGLRNNWRYLAFLFRAVCDAYIRARFLFESDLVTQAEALLLAGRLSQAETVLHSSCPQQIASLRDRLDRLSDLLFETIGMQLSVSRHGASGWERGATLDTIDRPITDREWLCDRLLAAKKTDDPAGFMKRCVCRNRMGDGDFYFSFALDGQAALGAAQAPDPYMDFQGDRPNVNNGTLPVCLQKLFDHTEISACIAGLACGADYELRVTYKLPAPVSRDLLVSANGHIIYQGPSFGGQTDETFTRDLLPDGFVAVCYSLPGRVIENGILRLKITEPVSGIKVAEFSVRKKEALRA